MNSPNKNSGSFRDPAGHVYHLDGRVFRSVNEIARKQYEAIRDRGLIRKAVADEYLIPTVELANADWPAGLQDAAHVLEHEPIPFVSYPYEWSFSQLKAAALHHLDFQLMLLEQDGILSDASAYNIQFVGTKPVFVDLLSIAPYEEGAYWLGHRQFCEQFLNPLLLRAKKGITHNAWYRGSLEGISSIELASLLSFWDKLSWNVFVHVNLLARMDKAALKNPDAAVQKIRSGRALSKTAFRGILHSLRRWTAKLQPKDIGETVWGEYAGTHTYDDEEADLKRRYVENFAAKVRPKTLIDIGCNTGDYSLAAIRGGAGYVIGFDFDRTAVEIAYSRSAAKDLPFLPLWLDAANPSPDQGWMQRERGGFSTRARADAMIALAFEHHLAIARNIPLGQVVEWLVQLAPQGIIEFVPKHDDTIQRMLALRKDIFVDYTEESFAAHLARFAKISETKRVSASGRTLYAYER